MPENTNQSNIISALHRLERAGSEHSASTAKLINAARTLSGALTGLVPEAEWDGWNLGSPPSPQLPRGYYRYRGGIGRRDTETDATVYVDDDRSEALSFAYAVADGWLDELATWLEARSAQDSVAVATLERAAAGLRGEVTQ